MEGLTKQQRRFAKEYPVDLNGKKAAIRANYSPKTAEAQASRLLRNVKVQKAIQKELEARAKRTEVTADQVLERWDRRARATTADFLTFRTVQEAPEVWVPIADAIAYWQNEVEVEREAARRLELTGKAKEEQDKELDKLEQKVVRLEVRAEREPTAMAKIPGPLITRIVADFDLAAMRDAGRLDLVKAVQRDKDGGYKVQLHDAAAADESIAKHLGMFVERHEHSGPGGKPLPPITLNVVNKPVHGAS
jgi:phage terminase small subunit